MIKPLILLSTALLLLLGGCAQRPAPLSQSAQQLAWQQHQRQLAQLSHWQLSGRIAIFQDANKQAGRLSWRQQGLTSRITISSVLGSSLLQVTYQPGYTEVINQQGERYAAADGEQLLYRLTGWQLPLAQLADWIKGLPTAAAYELDDQGWLASLSGRQPAGNSRWQVEYQRLREQSPRLPEAMTIENGELRIKLAIHQWQLHDTAL